MVHNIAGSDRVSHQIRHRILEDVDNLHKTRRPRATASETESAGVRAVMVVIVSTVGKCS
jgi:hypothetical protein